MTQREAAPMVILGGLRERRENLAGEGLQGSFEGALYECVYSSLMDDRHYGEAIWSALANIEWVYRDGSSLSYSFRAAGDLIACMLREGDYLEWYCCARPGSVSDAIAGGMSCYGWSWRGAAV